MSSQHRLPQEGEAIVFFTESKARENLSHAWGCYTLQTETYLLAFLLFYQTLLKQNLCLLLFMMIKTVPVSFCYWVPAILFLLLYTIKRF